MAKHKLSISLLKVGETEGTVFKDRRHVLHVDLANGQKLYYKRNVSAPAKWLTFFEEGMNNSDKDRFKIRSTSAVVFYTVNVAEGLDRTYAICFGYGKNLIKSDALERRFGLLVTLNSVKSDEIRSVDYNSLEANPLNSRTQASVLSPIGNFNIDENKDLLKSVTGKAIEEGGILNGTLSGSDSLLVSTEKSYNNINDLLVRCYNRFTSDKYKESFGWIDRIQGIKDKELINNLYGKMMENLNSPTPDKIWISIPEIINYQDISYFKLKSDVTYDDLDIGIVKREYPNNNEKSIKSHYIHCFNGEGTQIAKWSLKRCVYTEIVEGDKQYLLNDGKWYKVDQDFVNEVESTYAQADKSEVELPKYNKEIKSENDYTAQPYSAISSLKV